MTQNIKNKNTGITNQLNIVENHAPILINNNQLTKQLGSLPIPPDFYIGRNGISDQIHDLLNSDDNSMLLVYGNGGLGKTSIVSEYYYKYFDFYSHLIWLVPQIGIKESLISLASSLKIEVDSKLKDHQLLDEVIKVLSDLKYPLLLIIDNVNNIDDLNSNYKILRKFRNVKIIITSRIISYQNLKTLKVEKFDKESADTLFKHYYTFFKGAEQQILDKLLNAIDFNALIIELLAKTLNKFNNDLNENYPIQRLLEDIQHRGLLKITKSTDLETDYILQNAKPEDIIRNMYDICQISEDEKEILNVFSLIPSLPVSLVELNYLLPKINELDIKLLSLSTRGWIDFHKESEKFKIHPIVSEIVREKIKHLTRVSKRALDIFVASIMFLYLIPIFLIISILIRLESKGPTLIAIRKIGLKGKLIYTFRFRTFKLSNKEIYETSKTGRFLITTSFYRLPEIVNVLLGEMSLVGSSSYEYLKSDPNEELYRNLKVYAKPGFTNLYNTRKRKLNAPFNKLILDRVKCDIEYIQNWNMLMDIKILLRSILLIYKPERQKMHTIIGLVEEESNNGTPGPSEHLQRI